MPTTSDRTTVAEIDAQIAELQKQRAEIEAAERKAAMAGDARRAIALLAAMREAYKELESLFPGTFDADRWAAAATAQAWPRDGKIRRMADLSETEAANAREAGRKAVAGIK